MPPKAPRLVPQMACPWIVGDEIQEVVLNNNVQQVALEEVACHVPRGTYPHALHFVVGGPGCRHRIPEATTVTGASSGQPSSGQRFSIAVIGNTERRWAAMGDNRLQLAACFATDRPVAIGSRWATLAAAGQRMIEQHSCP